MSATLSPKDVLIMPGEEFGAGLKLLGPIHDPIHIQKLRCSHFRDPVLLWVH